MGGLPIDTTLSSSVTNTVNVKLLDTVRTKLNRHDCVDRIRSAGLAADIGLKEQQKSVGREAVYPQHAVSPRLPSTPVCYATVSF